MDDLAKYRMRKAVAQTRQQGWEIKMPSESAAGLSNIFVYCYSFARGPVAMGRLTAAGESALRANHALDPAAKQRKLTSTVEVAAQAVELLVTQGDDAETRSMCLAALVDYFACTQTMEYSIRYLESHGTLHLVVMTQSDGGDLILHPITDVGCSPLSQDRLAYLAGKVQQMKSSARASNPSPLNSTH